MSAVARAIDRYLNEVCWAMGGRFAEQQCARDELRAHIADALRERELEGTAPEAGLRDVLAELGEPAALGVALRASRGAPSLRRPLAQPEGAVLLGRRVVRHLRSPWPALALATAGLTPPLVALAYAWPR